MAHQLSKHSLIFSPGRGKKSWSMSRARLLKALLQISQSFGLAKNPLLLNEDIILIPIGIRIGSENANFDITDGPDALRYIFSVAKPTLDSPKIQNYYLPLLFISARAMYLACLYSAKPEPDNRNIPVMYCTMYVIPKSNPQEQLQFFLSSSSSGKNSVSRGKNSDKLRTHGARKFLTLTWGKSPELERVCQSPFQPLGQFTK